MLAPSVLRYSSHNAWTRTPAENPRKIPRMNAHTLTRPAKEPITPE